MGLGRRTDILENLKQSLADEHGGFHPRECDLANEEDILSAFEWIDETFGGISILVNAAGILRSTNMTGRTTGRNTLEDYAKACRRRLWNVEGNRQGERGRIVCLFERSGEVDEETRD